MTVEEYEEALGDAFANIDVGHAIARHAAMCAKAPGYELNEGPQGREQRRGGAMIIEWKRQNRNIRLAWG